MKQIKIWTATNDDGFLFEFVSEEKMRKYGGRYTCIGTRTIEVEEPKKIVRKEAKPFSTNRYLGNGCNVTYDFPAGAINIKNPTYDIEE
jgi:hypothetical protein